MVGYRLLAVSHELGICLVRYTHVEEIIFTGRSVIGGVQGSLHEASVLAHYVQKAQEGKSRPRGYVLVEITA